MIHLAAFANNNLSERIPEHLIRKWANYNIFPKLINRWTYAQGNVFMSIQGDCTISQYVHTSPRMAIICHTDLLGSDACNDFREANKDPARYLARLYEQKGDEFVRNLHGWFGILLYDFEQNTLKAWTDHFGVRRIVYKAISSSIGIASDLRLLNGFSAKSPEIDPQAILEYLQYACIPAPRTIYKDTFRLEPGHGLTSRPRVGSHVYWDMKYEEVGGRSLKTWASDTSEAIQSAVACAAKTLGDIRQLGCFLSGGTDSSSVSGLVGRITGKPPRTFSIGFDDSRYNEIEYARIAARAFHADHREYFVTPQDILDLIPLATHTYDEPFGNSSIVPSYYCAKLAKEHGVNHLLAGDGGDELFGGNERYVSDRVFQHYGGIPSFIRKGVVEPTLHALNGPFQIPVLKRAVSYVRRSNIPVPDRYFSYNLTMSVAPEELFAKEFLSSLNKFDLLEPAHRHFHHAPATNDLNRRLYLDLKITINDNDIRKVTPMVELAGVTPRYPLLDFSLAEFSGGIPATLKVKKGKLRFLFKKAMIDVLPREIVKKSKHGFGLPYSAWLGEHSRLKQLTFDVLGSVHFRQSGYFRPDLLEWLWSGYEGIHHTFYGDAIWVFLIFEAWHQQQEAEVSTQYTICSEGN